VAIEPTTGTAGTPHPVGNGPNLLSLSSDDSYLLVSIDGDYAIQRLALPALADDIRILIPADQFSEPQTALALEAAPVSSHTFAALVAPAGGFLTPVIYDDAIPRPNTPVSGFMWSLQWGKDDTTLLGAENAPSGDSREYVMTVDATGITSQQEFDSTFIGYPVQIHYDRATDRLIDSLGWVASTTTNAWYGSFDRGALQELGDCTPDQAQPVIFCVGQTSAQVTAGQGLVVQAFDKKSLALLRVLSISDTVGAPSKIVRWGNEGLAVNTVPPSGSSSASGAIYIIDGGFVSSTGTADFTDGSPASVLAQPSSMFPQSVTAGSSDVTLTIKGSNFQPGAVVTWNGSALSTSFVSPTELQAPVPSTRLGASGLRDVTVLNQPPDDVTTTFGFTILASSLKAKVINLASIDVEWDKNSNSLYAPVFGSDQQYPNSIVAIDPSSANVTGVALLDHSSPYIVRLSHDGSLAYTGYLVSSYVTRLNLPGLDSPDTRYLGYDSDGTHVAVDLQVAPGAPQTTAIILGNPYKLPEDTGGTAIFDGDTQRPSVLGWISQSLNFLQWGVSASTLYGVDNSDTSLSFVSMNINSSGISGDTPYDNAFHNAYNDDIHFDPGTGYIYNDDGEVIDPTNASHVGSYSAAGIVTPDSSLSRVFILAKGTSGGTHDYVIESFDQTKFSAISSIDLPNVIGTPYRMVRWGASGLAIATFTQLSTTGITGLLYIIDDPSFVSSAHSAIPVAPFKAGRSTWPRPRPLMHAHQIHSH
jgi:hypothetical protein